MYRPMDIGKNTPIGIIRPVAFIMTCTENYIFILEKKTGDYPHRCLMQYR